jgi:hypothetical protein
MGGAIGKSVMTHPSADFAKAKSANGIVHDFHCAHSLVMRGLDPRIHAERRLT